MSLMRYFLVGLFYFLYLCVYCAAGNICSKYQLFPTTLPGDKWVKFEAAGFTQSVTGVIYRQQEQGARIEGIPLSGLGTGYLDLDVDGTLGKCTIFNTFIRPRELGGLPFLGVAVNGKTHLLTVKKFEGVSQAEKIHYWGHYPIADIEYEIDSPVNVSLRAWSPFLLGDSVASNTPGAVFTIHLSNKSDQAKKVTVAFSFPGPSSTEMGKELKYLNHAGNKIQADINASREIVKGKMNFNGVVFSSTTSVDPFLLGNLNADYALGIIGDEEIRVGGALLEDNMEAWGNISNDLPIIKEDKPDSSVIIYKIALFCNSTTQ